MEASGRILTPAQCKQIAAKLDECIGFFEKRPRLLSASEIRIKSMLTMLRKEVAQAASADSDDDD
ncbi:MAG TPA: hypothetical protein VL200_09430 [Lacunisphaera sp.]|jgi:hypothetical protein|nr:hypothetical protein [Lacunisphaera sp.]